MNRLFAQRGVALITVLLVVALVAVIAVSMSGRLKGQVSRTHATEMAEQGYWYWLSAEQLLRQVLLTELDEDDYVHGAQNWATQHGPYPVDGGFIGGRVRDMHSCFNVNSLFTGSEDSPNADAALALEQYQALLAALDFDEFTRQQLSATLIDWLDEDTVLVNSYGAEDADYESMAQPYQAANAMMSHTSELRQVVGYTRDVYERLRPYICAIPGSSELAFNLNTMDAEKPELVSAIFLGQLDVSQAANLLAQWPEQGYDDVSEITQLAELQALREDDGDGEGPLPGQQSLTVHSEFFELRAAVLVGESEFFALSIVQIRDGSARVIHRSRRGYDWND